MPNLLTRLEMNGFKSFAEKTVLEFPEGITAVVGPNGSGKSNVIDAIRWLLGERDARNLRGGKGEDLVFAGTPERARMGLAQASLYFDNRSKFFPVDFKEIVVTREVARDGSNKYFINKSEVRLKDLIDFFAQARLGSRGITVVTQGNSDMFIRASGKERREMIEEVLGLKEYQLKKHEAERKLANSESNLDKVMALIEEITPHLRSLKRQTGRWEKRDELEKELKELEDNFFGSQLRRLNSELNESEKKLAEHKKLHHELQEEKTRAHKRLEEVEGQKPKEQKELKDIKLKTAELLEERSKLQKELGRIEAQIEISSKMAKRSHSSNEDLKSVLKEIKDNLNNALSEPIEGMRHAINKSLELIKKAFNEDVDAKEQEPSKNNEFASALESTNKLLADLEADLQKLSEEEKELEKNQEEFYSIFKSALRALEQAQHKLDEWSRQEQQYSLQAERLMIRKEEVIKQIRQADRNPEEFLNTSSEGKSEMDMRDAEKRIFKLRGELAAIGEIDEAIVKEAKETEERHAFLERESEDLKNAQEDLKNLISDLSIKISEKFDLALSDINKEFQKFFDIMFGGGKAKLVAVQSSKKIKQDSDEESEDEASDNTEDEAVPSTEKEIEIQLSLPRKRINSLDMLSGGERSLVGIAALFSLISVSPPPFLVLDEIDAPLDERNARRFAELLREFSKDTQFVVVTHNRATMEAAHILYGVTLGQDGASKVVSLQLSEAKQAVN